MKSLNKAQTDSANKAIGVPEAFSVASLMQRCTELVQNWVASKGNQAAIVGVCKAELTGNSMKASDLSKDELDSLYTNALEAITRMGYAPCQRDAEGKAVITKTGDRAPLTAQQHATLKRDVKASLLKTGTAKKAASKAKPADDNEGEISAQVPQDRAPQGDGKAALAALDGDKERRAMLALAEELRGDANDKTKKLAALVLAYFQ